MASFAINDTRRNSSSDPALRSLLQKAVRRGYVSTVRDTVARLAEMGDSAWLRSRAAVIAFEECWPAMGMVSLNGQHDPLMMLLAVTQSVKQKDAAGLGSLAYAYSEGDASASTGAPDSRAVRIVSAAYARPVEFFDWAQRRCESPEQTAVVEMARKNLSLASWPWDKSCILAGAYLAITSGVPRVKKAEIIGDSEFPYWVAIDKHTPQGKAAMRKVATNSGLPVMQVQWASFYFESALTNALEPSAWWETEQVWRLHQIGLTASTAEAIWADVAGEVQRAVTQGTEALRNTIAHGGPIAQTTLLA